MTNKTKLSAAALFSATILGASFFAASAAGVHADTNSTVNSATGNAYVTFTKDKPSSIPDPSDPTVSDPSNHDPENSTGNVGVLTLDAIPRTLDFGTQEATGATQKVNLMASDNSRTVDDAATTTEKGARKDNSETTDGAIAQIGDTTGRSIFTQVTDLDSSNPTWTLSAALNGFTNSKNEAGLAGATITLANGVDQTLNTEGTAWTAADANDALKASTVTLTSDGAAVPYLTSSQSGISQQVWNTKDVNLNVAAGTAAPDTYTATIDWTLSVTVPDTTTNPEGGA